MAPEASVGVTHTRAIARLLSMLGTAIPVGAQPSVGAGMHAREFRIDAAHSSVEFEIPFMYGTVRGRFNEVRGAVLLDDSAGSLVRSSAMAIVRTASVNTGSSHRDKHLRSADFFDADRYPALVFRSTAVEGDSHDFVLMGTLDMHGRIRPIRMPCSTTVAPVHDAHHVVIAVIGCTGTLARRDFDIVGGDAHNVWFDNLRSATMGDSVKISLTVHLWAPDASNPDAATRANVATIDKLGIDSAIAHLRSAFVQDSMEVVRGQPVLDAVGQALLAAGRVRDGFLWLHAVARLLPKSADAAVSVGVANAMMGDTTRASAWFAQARQIDSLNARAYTWTVAARPARQ